jgi:hypothetical protein
MFGSLSARIFRLETLPLRFFGGILVLFLFLSACSLVGNDEGTVSATASPPELTIQNQTDESIYTFTVGRQRAALINWAPSVGGEGIAAGGEKHIQYEDIPRSEGGEEAIVYWWTAVRDDGERVPGEIQSIVVEL